MVIILLGAPGSGKGTQAKTLAEKIGLAHISTGDLLRHNVSSGTLLGKKAVSFMNQGLLVPDDLVIQMLEERISREDYRAGFIFDGYPRNLAQAGALSELLKRKNESRVFVFYLEASEPVIIQRLSGRLVCNSCGANFHIKNMPPRKEMICDYCGGRLYQRQDDKEETVRKRLEVYRQQAQPLIEYYEKENKFYRINADGPAQEVIDKIIEIVNGAK